MSATESSEGFYRALAHWVQVFPASLMESEPHQPSNACKQAERKAGWSESTLSPQKHIRDVPLHPKGALLDWVLVTGSHFRHRNMSTLFIERWTWPATRLRQAVVFKWCLVDSKGPKVCQESIPNTITPLPDWTVDARQDQYSLILTPNLPLSNLRWTYENCRLCILFWTGTNDTQSGW